MTVNVFRGPDHGLDFDYSAGVAMKLGVQPGEGVTIGHFDEGWELDHPLFSLISGLSSKVEFMGETPIRQGRFEHGNAVLGMLIGQAPEPRGQGALLPGARHLLIQSRDSEAAASAVLLKSAIEVLGGRLPAILLIARDWTSRAPHLPYELKPGMGAMLAEATRRGIVVVESAGNAGLNLAELVVRNGASALNQVTIRDDPWITAKDQIEPAFGLDTGAIIVGACTSSRPHHRWLAGFATNPQPRSNFGSRIDSWAHGERLTTASISPGVTNDFGGTSGAAAIIAAGIATIQSIAVALTPDRMALTPSRIREILRDRTYGHPVYEMESTIGSVPNLRSIMDDLVSGILT